MERIKTYEIFITENKDNKDIQIETLKNELNEVKQKVTQMKSSLTSIHNITRKFTDFIVG